MASRFNRAILNAFMVQPTYHAGAHFARQRRSRSRWSLIVARTALACTVLGELYAVEAPLHAQSAATSTGESHAVDTKLAELLAAGDRESQARHPALALPFYERAVQYDSQSAVALWKASRELVDLGEFEPNAEKRMAFYAKAADYSRKAVALTPNDPEVHFHLARALGRTALALGPRERVKYGIDVRTQALRTLELAPKHPGALHVMGVWNAEIMRLSGLSRLVAKTFLGGKIFDTASWAEATRYMEQSVAVEPERMVHRLDLARVYRDTGRKADARAAYQAAIAAPLVDANDERYRDDAKRELALISR